MTQTRTSTRTRARATKPPTVLTPGGRARIAERIASIRQQRLADMLPLLVERERDERVVAEFERLLLEASTLEAVLAEAEVMSDDASSFDGRVAPGMRVRIALADGSQEWVRPVNAVEAFLDEERISLTSPLAVALLGARVSHVVWVDAPAGPWACTILDIDPRVSD
jgi:transcription elongation factor GreA